MTDALHRQHMKSLLEGGQFSDVTLVVMGKAGGEEQNVEFKAHRCLLAYFSPVFAAMFSRTETKEALEKSVVIEDVSVDAMHRLLIYGYTRELKYDKKEKEGPLLELLTAADKYQVDSLKKKCVNLLAGFVTVDSVWDILKYAEFHNAPELKEQCLDFMVENAACVISRLNVSWLQFNETACLELIKEFITRLA